MVYDVAVIGGGVIGSAILRELTKYSLKTVLLEKESDVCMGASRANSGIVHAGFDAPVGSNKAKFNVEGSKMMKSFARDLGVKYKNNGSIVVAFNQEEQKTLQELLARGKKNGVKSLSIIGKEELKKLVPNISDNAVSALYAKTGGIVCPYELTIAEIGNAMDNGAELKLDFNVVAVKKSDGFYSLISESGETVLTKIVINAAGAGSEYIAKLFGDESVKIGYRRGEYILLDRESGDLTSHTLFFTPTEKGKGILVSNTVDGNILLGPTAENMETYDTDTSAEGLDAVIAKAKTMMKTVPLFNTITSFAGVRAYSKDRHDFVIEKSKVADGLINVCGIESPGLSSAPAIAKYVVEELLPASLKVKYNLNFNGKRKPDYYFKTLSIREKNKIIKQKPEFGKIVCRCEQVTEGEIIEAVTRNPKATTIDAVKRRTRSGMGRCQGGFCQSRVAEIIAKETGISLDKVTKSGKNSEILTGETK